MTAPAGEVARVTGTWLTLERTLAREPEGIMATVTITSAAPSPVAVQVVEALPPSWDVTEIGVHPRYEPQEFTAEPSRIVYADVVRPDEDRTVVYGVRVADDGALDPPESPVVEEALLADREDAPFGLTADGGLSLGESATAPPADEPVDTGWLDAGAEAIDDRPAAEAGATPGDGPAGPDLSTPGQEDGPDVDDVSRFEFEFGDASTADGEADTDTPVLFDEEPAPGRGEAGSGPDVPFTFDHEPDDQPAVDESDGQPAVDQPDAADSDPVDGSVTVQPPPQGGPAAGESARGSDDSHTEDAEWFETPPDDIIDAANVLVLADHADTAAGCTDLLERQAPPGSGMVLVSFLQSVDDRLQDLEGLPSGSREIDLVCMGEQLRSTTAETSTLSTPIGEVTVTSIADATDLVRLGVHVGRALDDAGDRPALCLHSLSALVGLVDLQRVFRFLHVLSGRVRAVDGRAHYHLDPSTIDEPAFETLRQLFEVVVRYEDGRYVVE